MNNRNPQNATAERIAKNGISLVLDGKVRNHKLRNSSRIHTGEMENKECRIYRDFLPSKNCCIVLGLTGSDCYD